MAATLQHAVPEFGGAAAVFRLTRSGWKGPSLYASRQAAIDFITGDSMTVPGAYVVVENTNTWPDLNVLPANYIVGNP